MNNEPRKTANIQFSYFKQGDDFYNCKGDLNKFIELHHHIAQEAQNILNMIPEEAREYVSGYGDTHMCRLTGPESVMDNLVSNKLAYYDSEDESDGPDFDCRSEDENDDEEKSEAA